MITSEGPASVAGVSLPNADGDEAGNAVAAALTQLANEFFTSFPNLTVPGAVGMSPPAPATLPPVPGALHAPPLAASPPPKESDLRTLPAMLSEATGISSPVALASGQPAEPVSAPYFLGLAGIPRSSGDVAPSSPMPAVTSAPSPVAVPGGQPAAPASAPYFLELAGLPRANGDIAPPAPLPAVTGEQPPPVFSTSLVDSSGAVPGFGASPEVSGTPSVREGKRLFDPVSIRRDFPILEERVNGRRIVWLDNAATTQKPRAVIERLSYFYEHENSNIHRAAHTLAARATDAYEGARDKVRRFINAPSSGNIVFVRGTTEGINLVAQSWGRRNVEAGDEIVVSWLEHHANIVPWQMLCREKGARLRVIPVDDSGQVLLEDYERLLGPRTRIVAVSQVSNALGTIVPVAEMIAAAHRYGARFLVDGAQSVSHMPVDVQSLDADFFVFSGHKVFAPTGIGAVYGKSDVLESMPPWQGGGNMIADVTFEKTIYQGPPGRFEAGTGNIADAVGLGAALDYVTEIGLPNIARYEHELLEYGTEQLYRVPGLRMIGTAKEKAGVLSFVLDGVRPEDVGKVLDQEGIAVRAGHHCAQPILRRFGQESTVRASLAPYNTCEDIDRLVAALLRLRPGPT